MNEIKVLKQSFEQFYPHIAAGFKEETKEQMIQRKFKELLKSNESSNRKMFYHDEDRLSYIKQCESIYKRSTKDHLLLMKENEYEGNLDERKWTREAEYLMGKGLLEL